METLSYLKIEDSLRLKLETRLNEFRKSRISYVEETKEDIISESTKKKTKKERKASLFEVLFINEYDTVRELFSDIGGQFARA